MRRFRFRLDGLLRLRSQMERAAQRDLAMAAADVAAVEEHMRLLQQGLSECDEQSRGSGAVAMLSRTMADGLQRQRLRLVNDLRGAQARLDRAKKDWMVRRRDQQIIERLRDRQKEQWQQEQAREEQLQLEELTRLRDLGSAPSSVEVQG
jgi:flagellar export protein FliJ